MYQYEITNPKFGASWCCVRSAFPVYTPDIGKNQSGGTPLGLWYLGEGRSVGTEKHNRTICTAARYSVLYFRTELEKFNIKIYGGRHWDNSGDQRRKDLLQVKSSLQPCQRQHLCPRKN